MRVLIVEDELCARKALVAGARGWNSEAEIEEAENSRTALEALRQQPFDILLLDIGLQLPDRLSLMRDEIEVYSVVASGVCRNEGEACWLDGSMDGPESITGGIRCFAAGIAGTTETGVQDLMDLTGRTAVIYQRQPGWIAALIIDTAEKDAPVLTGNPRDGQRVFISDRFPIRQASTAAHQLNSLYGFRCLTEDSIVTSAFLSERTEYRDIMNAEDFIAFGDLLSEHREAEAAAVALGLIRRYTGNPALSTYCVQDALAFLCAQMNRISARDGLTAGIHLTLRDADAPAALEEAVLAMVRTICRRPLEKISRSGQIVRVICDYIDIHYAENISLQTLAKTRLYLNVSYLSRLFKAETGRSFRNYLTDVRLDKAREQIRLRDESVTQIAVRCGYTDVSHFIQLFRNRFGLTPNAWREICIREREEKVK